MIVKTLWHNRDLAVGILLLSALFAGLVTSFIPLQYTAEAIVHISPITTDIEKIKTPQDIKPNLPDIVSLQKKEEQFIKSDAFLQSIATHLKLFERKEFNPKMDIHRALTDRITDSIKIKLHPEEISISTDEKILQKLNQNLTLSISNDYNMILEYQSASPYLARAIVNLIAQKYTNESSPDFTKKVTKESNLPHRSTSPKIKDFILYFVLFGTVLATVCMLAIYQHRKKEFSSNASH